MVQSERETAHAYVLHISDQGELDSKKSRVNRGGATEP